MTGEKTFTVTTSVVFVGWAKAVKPCPRGNVGLGSIFPLITFFSPKIPLVPTSLAANEARRFVDLVWAAWARCAFPTSTPGRTRPNERWERGHLARKVVEKGKRAGRMPAFPIGVFFA